jgi:alpha-tubulin suppressor-like RCC1 family protein
MASQPQHRLLGFGSNYFHALGGSKDILLGAKNDVPAHEYPDETFDVQQICCTTTSTVILTKSGKVYQTGMMHGHLKSKPTRIPVPMALPVSQIAGGRHFCLAKCGNAVLSWGAGHFGQLGHGPNVSLLGRPEVISHLSPEATGSTVAQIACGSWHGSVLMEDGRIYCWGSNRRNQCGSKSPSTVVYPQAVDGSFSKIACGKGHCIALERESGRVFTWGSSVGCGHSSRKTAISPPRLVEALQRVVIVDIAAGDSHSLALTGGGRVFSWGLGPEGQLGVGGAFPIIPRPKLVGDLDFVAVVAGQQVQTNNNNASNHINGNVNANAIHSNISAHLEASMSTMPYAPNLQQQQNGPASQLLANVPKVVSIHAAGSYSLAISSVGHVYAWGYNDPGVLGLAHPPNLPTVEPASSSSATISQIKSRTPESKAFDSRHNVLLPQRVDALSNLRITSVAGGPSHLLLYGEVRDPNETTVIGRTLYEVQQARRSSQIHAGLSGEDDLSVHSVETDAITTATDAMSQLTVPTPSVLSPISPASAVTTSPMSSASAVLSPMSPASIKTATTMSPNGFMKQPATPVYTPDVKIKAIRAPASAPAAMAASSTKNRSGKTTCSLSMPKIMQKLSGRDDASISNRRSRRAANRELGNNSGGRDDASNRRGGSKESGKFRRALSAAFGGSTATKP